MKRLLLLFVAVALLYAGPGLLPGKRLVPADIPSDYLAWKGDPAIRVRVSNSLLSDVPLQLIPWDVESRRLLARGEMPWTNHFTGTTGHLFANPLAGLLSPFTWPRLLLGLQGWAWTVLMKIVVAALGAYWLGRVLEAGQTAAVLAALMYALSGFAIVWALYPHTNVFAVLPALAAAAVSFANAPSPRGALVIAGVAALATAGGHPETLFVGVVAIFAFLLVTRRAVAGFAASSLAGFLLIGVQLVPFVLLLADSHAIGARSGQLEIRFRKLTPFAHILPGYLGSPLRGEIDLTGPVKFAENFNQRSGGFIGALALLALALTWQQQSRDMRRALEVAVGALVLTLALPGISHIAKMIPLLGWVAFEYFQVAFLLFATAAAGVAIVLVARGPARPRLGVAIIVAGTLLLLAGVLPAVAPGLLDRAARAGVSRLQSAGYLSQSSAVYEQRLAHYTAAARATAFRRAALPAISWIIAGAALMTNASRRREITLGAAAVAELIVFGLGFNPAIRVDQIARAPQMIADVKSRDPKGEWLIASSNEVFPPNLGTLYGVRQSHAYDILMSETDAERLQPAGYDPKRWDLPLEPTAEQLRALAARGVRFYLTPRGLLEIPDAPKAPPQADQPPRGLLAGALVSLAGAVLLALTLRRYSHSIVLGGLDETS